MHLRIKCPAKVNLFLAVGPKDARNYHPIRTIFQAIDLCDVITIRRGNDKHRVQFDDPSIPAENTVTKALRLLSEIVKLPPLDIAIEKHIPPESGLAGGSSNAAGILRAAQSIAGGTLPDAELKGIAEGIGMDVPFFLIGGRAKAEGYGQRLTPLPDGETMWFVVARPQIGCGTAEAYRRLDEIAYDWRDFSENDELYNDFERVAPVESSALIERLKRLGAIDATLCGSGSAVFGRFTSSDFAEQARRELHQGGASYVWAAATLSRAECQNTLSRLGV